MTKPYNTGKDDVGKNRLGLVLGGFAGALEAVGRVGTYGATVYSENSWRLVDEGVARYTDALLRHQISKMTGQRLDKESGMLQAAHVAWNALAILQLEMDKAETIQDNFYRKTFVSPKLPEDKTLNEDCGL